MRKNVKRWAALAMCLALAGTVMTGCGSEKKETEANSQAEVTSAEAVTEGETAATATEGSEPKDTITFAQGSDITSLDPHVGKQLRAFAVTCNMFEQLVKLDENMEPQPSLAESWERISDTEVRFKLRQGVKWQNGDPFTADDVKFSYERMMNSALVANNISFLESVTVEDEHTVVLKTKYPYASLLAGISTPPCSIVPKKVVEELGDDEFALNPVGTGPYKFVEWKPDEYVKLEANEDYWGEKAKTKYLVMKVVPEATQRSIMLETGEIDLAYDIAPNDVARLKEAEGVNVLVGKSMKTVNLNFNFSSEGPLGNKLVRQAISYAIDQEGIVEGLLGGIGTPGIIPIPSSAFGYDGSLQGYGYDPEKAKELLKEAGYENGFECSMWVDDDQVYTQVATVIQSSLAEIGITMNIEPMKQSTKLDRLVKHEDFDMNIAYFNNIVGDADYNLYSNLAPESKSNHCYYNNQKVSDLITEGRSTFDDEKRKAVYKEIYGILLDEMPILNLYEEQTCVGITNKVDGFTLNKIGAHKYQNVVVYK